MVKIVASQVRIELAGRDISDRVTRIAIVGKVGELWGAEVDIVETPATRTITLGRIVNRETGEEVTLLQPEELDCDIHQATILVDGADVSHWVHKIELTDRQQGQLGEYRWYRLHIYADADILTINGTHPWVYNNTKVKAS